MQRAFLTLILVGLTTGLSRASAQTLTEETTSSTFICNSYSGVVANDGKPLASVSVMVKGTNIVIITNEAGFYNLPDRVKAPPVLALSAAGYAPQEFTYTNCTTAAIEMQMLPGTRIRKHGKRKGQLKWAGDVRAR